MKTDLEIWKDIEGYEGLYQVSSHGRIKRLKAIIIDSIGRRQGKRGYRNKKVK